MISVYVAMPLASAVIARHWSSVLTRAGLLVMSTWHAGSDSVDPHHPEIRRRILTTNLIDLRNGDVLFADTRTGVPGCTFAEVGFALALDKRVVWLQPVGRRIDNVKAVCLMDAHALVSIVTAESEVIPALRRAVEGR